MAILRSHINLQSETFRKNREANTALLEELEAHLEKSRFQGKEKYIQRNRKAGKMLARERIEMLLDPDSPFLELLPLAGLGHENLIALGGTMTAGIGLVSGLICLITANIGTIKGGAIDFVTLRKSLRVNEIAMENRLPVINLVESAGANLPEQAKIFNYGGANFRDITRRSKEGLPTISVVFGNSTAGGAYIPGMSDYTIMVKNQAKVFLAGPPLVYMATQEVTDDESLGGADMHSRVSGVSDFLADDERDALRITREIMSSLGDSFSVIQAPAKSKEPLYPAAELLGIISADLKHAFDAREIIARVVDGSEFTEFKANFGESLVCGFASIHGFPVGIIANNGVLFSESAQKGTHFIQLCNRANKPILFLQNTTGFMVGSMYEERGIIKHGSHLINAVANSEVPMITLMIGASFGAGNYAMCGRAFQPRFLFSYPNARIAVMGPDQLAGVMEIIQREAANKSGQPFNEEQARQIRTYMMQQVEQESSAFYSTGQLWDDGIIDPLQTRNYLGFCMTVIHQAGFQSKNRFGVFRM